MLLRDKRIFIVEDDAFNLAIATTFLRQEGATIQFERWGRDTCTRLIEFAPVDIILLDLMFPNNVTGYEVYDEIRRSLQFSDVPIIAVTAADPDIAMAKARDKGFSGFIAKPISTRFARYISEVINGKSVWIANSTSV